MGAEGFQRASGKPFGRARRRESPRTCGHTMLDLQKMMGQNPLSTIQGAFLVWDAPDLCPFPAGEMVQQRYQQKD